MPPYFSPSLVSQGRLANCLPIFLLPLCRKGGWLNSPLFLFFPYVASGLAKCVPGFFFSRAGLMGEKAKDTSLVLQGRKKINEA